MFDMILHLLHPANYNRKVYNGSFSNQHESQKHCFPRLLFSPKSPHPYLLFLESYLSALFPLLPITHVIVYIFFVEPHKCRLWCERVSTIHQSHFQTICLCIEYVWSMGAYLFLSHFTCLRYNHFFSSKIQNKRQNSTSCVSLKLINIYNKCTNIVQ